MKKHNRLKTERLNAELSQKEAAAKIGIQASHLSEIENNKRNVSLDMYKRILEAYGLTVDITIK